jgi:hypothetical protein
MIQKVEVTRPLSDTSFNALAPFLVEVLRQNGHSRGKTSRIQKFSPSKSVQKVWIGHGRSGFLHSGRFPRGISASPSPPKARDHVGLIQETFQQHLKDFTDAIGTIQPDATAEPIDNPDFIPMTYDGIPEKAKQVVKQTLLIDTLIDETISTTFLAKDQSELLAAIKEESDQYEQKVGALSDCIQQAEVWIGRTTTVLDVIVNMGLRPSEEDPEEDFGE